MSEEVLVVVHKGGKQTVGLILVHALEVASQHDVQDIAEHAVTVGDAVDVEISLALRRS